MKSGIGCKVDHLHLFEEGHRHNPFAFYAKLRKEQPVAWDKTLKAWIVTDAADIQAVLKDPKTFSSNRVDLARARFTDPALKPLIDTLGLLMLQRDDPDHRRLRKLVHAAFERTTVEAYAADIEKIARDLLASAARTGRLEFVEDLAVPLPIKVINKIVGIPPEDQAKVKAWCDAFSIVALNFYAQITPQELQAGRTAVAEFRDYLANHLAEKRAHHDNSLLSALADAEEDGEKLTLDELLANTLLLLNAGNETTTILLSNGLHHLLTHPQAMAALRKDRSKIPDAIEEMLRYEAPVHFIGRITTKDTELAGQTVKAGDLVLVFLASAGRDERRFDHNDTFDITRHPNRHQAFGNGPHLCAGVQLAKLEARIAFNTVLDMFSDLALEPGPLTYGPNLNLRALAALPVRVTPSAAP